MNSLTTEAGFVSLNKQGEQLCGDRVETKIALTRLKETIRR